MSDSQISQERAADEEKEVAGAVFLNLGRVRPLALYCKYVSRYPPAVMFVYISLVFLLIGLGYKPLEVGLEMKNFVKADGQAQREYDAVSALTDASSILGMFAKMLQAMNSNEDTSQSVGSETSSNLSNLSSMENISEVPTAAPTEAPTRRLQSPFINPFSSGAEEANGVEKFESFDFSLMYVPRYHKNALTKSVLAEVKDFEERLRGLGDWKQYCNFSEADSQHLCDPGQSIVTYLWPSREQGLEGHEYVYHFHGRGSQLYFDVLFTYLQQSESSSYFFPKSWDAEGTPPEALQTFFEFKVPVTKYFFLEQFILQEVYPFLKKEQEQLEHVKLLYYKYDILEREQWETFYSDCSLVGMSLAFVTLYMWNHTRSLCVTLYSLMLILLSLPLAYGTLPSGKINLSSVFAVFLMLGIGADNVFVILDFWEQAAETQRLDQRLAFTLEKSFSACIVTSITTAASFYANLTSALRNVRELGFFVGMCVTNAFLLLVLLLPPLLAFREKSGRSAAAIGDATPQNVPNTDTAQRTRNRPTRIAVWIFWKTATRPRTILLISFLAVIIFSIMIPPRILLSTTVPRVFKEESHMVQSEKYYDKFEHGVAPLSQQAFACDPRWSNNCDFHWCTLTSDVRSCWRSPTQSVSGNESWGLQHCSTVDLRSRFASLQEPSFEEVQIMWHALSQAEMHPNSSDLSVQLLSTPLVVEDWESGNVMMQKFYSTEIQIVTDAIGEHCMVETVCFLANSSCDLTGWVKLEDGLERRLSEANSSDAPNKSQSSLQSKMQSFVSFFGGSVGDITVVVYWGVIPAMSTPLLGLPEEDFEYDPRFAAENPWAQRAMYGFCKDASKRFDVVSCKSWLDDFQKWLQEKGARFPSREFKLDMEAFGEAVTAPASGYKFESGKMKGSSVELGCGMPMPLAEFKLDWNGFLEHWNRDAPLSANHARHASRSYATKESEDALVFGTVETVILAISSSFGSMFLFTANPRLSCIVSCLVVMTILSLLFIMVVLLDWTLGPVEMLCLIIFVGYSVTFSLHIAHTYCEDMGDKRAELLERAAEMLPAEVKSSEDSQESRPDKGKGLEVKARVLRAMEELGGAVLSSSLSTAGSSAVLLLCQLTFFPTIGTVLLVVTAISTFMALVLLPAAILCLQPDPEPLAPCFHRLKACRVRVQTQLWPAKHDEASDPQQVTSSMAEPWMEDARLHENWSHPN